MNAILALQVSIGIFSHDLHGYALDASLITILHIRDGHLIAVGFTPTHVHTHEHLRPVLAFRAASPRIDLHHCIHWVFLLAQHILQFQVFYGTDSLSIVSIHFLLAHHILMVEVEGKLKLICILTHFLVPFEPFLDTLHLLHLLLGTLGIFPKVRSLGTELLFFKFYFLLVYVQIAMQRISTLHHVFQLIGCYHSSSYILSITFAKFL